MERLRIAVIGLGNVLLGDDGFGPRVIAHLRATWNAPPAVALIDGGTAGLGLVTRLTDCDVAILVDCVAGGGAAGALRSYRGVELDALPRKPRVSPHAAAVGEALALARLATGRPTDAVVIGVVPQSVQVGTELSAPVLASVPAAVALVVDAVQTAIGVRALQRSRDDHR
jgi:hydrogenase maturation protease